MTVADRLVKVKNALLRRLQHLATTEAKRDWVAKELDTLSNQELHALYGQKTIDDFADEQAQAAYLARRWAQKNGSGWSPTPFTTTTFWTFTPSTASSCFTCP